MKALEEWADRQSILTLAASFSAAAIVVMTIAAFIQAALLVLY